MLFKRKRKPGLFRTVGFLLVLVALAILGVMYWSGWGAGPSASDTKGPAALAAAQEYVQQGKIAEARQVLEPLVTPRAQGPSTPQALMLMAQLEQSDGNLQEAIALLKRAALDFAGSPEHPRSLLAYAQILEDTGHTEEGVNLYGQVRDSAPPPFRSEALCGLGREATRKGDLLAARDLYQKALDDSPWNSETWNKALDGLGTANVALIFAPMATPDSKVYTVARGDSLNSIGVQLNTTQGLLMRANGLDEHSVLHLGQTLKYTPKDFRIVVERSSRRIFLLDKTGLFKRYSTGLGMPGHETALGSYKIGDKQKDPVWHKPGEGPIPPLDPRNELGTRWMPLVPVVEGLPADLGIHGTVDPSSIGKYSSHGCPRMFKEDVEELYDLVVRSTPVDIVETFQPGQRAGTPSRTPPAS